jgi:hypothetical protein
MHHRPEVFEMTREMKIIVGVLAASAAAYVAVAMCFRTRFMPNSTLNGMNVSLKSTAEVEQMMRSDASGYRLTITGRDGVTDSISAEDVSLEPVFDGSVEKQIRRQEIFLWPLSFLIASKRTASSAVNFSVEKLKAKVDALAFFDASNVEQPKDAYVDFQDGKFTIVPDTAGSSADRDKVCKAVEDALMGFATDLSLDDAGCYETAKVRADDPELAKEADELNRIATASLTFKFGDSSEVLDAGTFRDWITMENGSIVVDDEKVRDYVTGLADKYDTYGKDRSFKTHGGNTVTVPGGSYGWWMDVDSTTAAVVEAIGKGDAVEMEPVWFQEAAAFGESDIGNSYVEVDLDDQHVWVYRDGEEVVSTDCVSGKAVMDHITPDGTYPITFRQKDATLVGEDYSSKVAYWMPFNRNVGMHDASWRSSFGGKIYVNSGSHGCVNLPPEMAGKVFDNVRQGEAVVVYGGMTQKEAIAYNEEKGIASVTEDSSSKQTASAPAAAATAPAGDASGGSAGQQAATQAAVTQALQAAQAAQQAAAEAMQASQNAPDDAELAQAAKAAQAAADQAVAYAQQLAGMSGGE